jgi:sugar transferase (PEP-CTERM/EpsH1 system associated)
VPRSPHILLLTQVLPYPPDSGPKVKTWTLLEHLGARYTVTVASFTRDESARELEAVRRRCHALHTVPMHRGALRDAAYLLASVAAGEPFVMRRDRRPAMHRLVAQLAARGGIDLVHIDQLNMAQYAAVPGAATVLDAHNALWMLYRRIAALTPMGPRRWLLEREWRRLRTYEGRIGAAVDAVTAVSAEDAAALRSAIGADADLTVLPIAVDCEEVVPVRRRANPCRIVHIGTMFWPPNADAVRWFATDVYPRIRAVRPDVGFDIIGARPPRAVADLARPGSNIRVTGYVADPTPYLEDAAAVVVPLRAGSGMRVKILTALAQELPVVSTTIGCEGIAASSGQHLLIADDAAGFAAAVLRVLGDRALADALGANGRRLVRGRYDARLVHRQLDDLYDRVLRSGAAPRRLRA